MYVLRCTQKLLRRLGSDLGPDDPAPSTALGNWYANLFNVGHLRLVHLVSDRSLLSVLVPSKNIRDLPARHKDALAQVLATLGIEDALVEAELLEMAEWSIGRTASRSVLGSMRDLAISARWRLWTEPHYTLMELAFDLAQTPCGPLDMRHPAEVATSLLRQRYAQPAQSPVRPNNSLEPTRTAAENGN